MFNDLMKQQREQSTQTTMGMGGKINRILSSTVVIVILLILSLSFSACKKKTKEIPNEEPKQEEVSTGTKKTLDAPEDSSRILSKNSEKPDSLNVASMVPSDIQVAPERYMPADSISMKITLIQRGIKTHNLLLLIAVIILAVILALMAWKTFFIKNKAFVWPTNKPSSPDDKERIPPKKPWKWEDK
ncbi:MAG: hypothetical protein LHW56_05450 [Candidatus Cloacimonetes bacterium]|nr:hypothetical protein [Candidatus Cloacimonadota bacterium]MDY0172334.1 hypothetical protein [Candidatus Cloacimonadaceae bacterium]